MLSNSAPLIPSFCAIERTKGEKNLFESDDLGIEVVSIVSSIIFSILTSSSDGSTSTLAAGVSSISVASAFVSMIATA